MKPWFETLMNEKVMSKMVLMAVFKWLHANIFCRVEATAVNSIYLIETYLFKMFYDHLHMLTMTSAAVVLE
jgi:hypothetical protein